MKKNTPAESSALPFAAPISAFLDYLRHEKRYSPQTLKARAADLLQFQQYCQRAQLSNVAALSTHDVRDFLSAQHRRELDPSTLHRHLSSVRSWLNFLVRRQNLPANPATAVRAPKQRRKLPSVLSADALGQALDQTPNDPLDVRDHALVELLYSTGLRNAELRALNVADIAGGAREIRIIGKGNRERGVMMGDKARQALQEWLKVRAQFAHPDESALFTGTRGQRLSAPALAVALRDWARRRQLPSHLHPHRLRHSFATHLLENSGNLRAVQEMLGHANLSTTQIYTHLDWKHLAQVYDDTHPRSRRKTKPAA